MEKPLGLKSNPSRMEYWADNLRVAYKVSSIILDSEIYYFTSLLYTN